MYLNVPKCGFLFPSLMYRVKKKKKIFYIYKEEYLERESIYKEEYLERESIYKEEYLEREPLSFPRSKSVLGNL